MDEPKPAAKAPEPEQPPSPAVAEEDERKTTPPPAKDSPATAPRRAGSRHSIKAVLKGETAGDAQKSDEDEEDPLAPQPGKPREKVEPEAVEQFIKVYAEKLGQQNQPRLQAVIEPLKPEIEGEELHLRFDNQTLLQSFQREIKRSFLLQLRESVQNYSLNCRESVVPGSMERDPYGPQEIFRHLSEKNPELERLQKKLNMRLKD